MLILLTTTLKKRNPNSCWLEAKFFPCLKVITNLKSTQSHKVREVSCLLQIPVDICATVQNASQHLLWSHPMITLSYSKQVSASLE